MELKSRKVNGQIILYDIILINTPLFVYPMERKLYALFGKCQKETSGAGAWGP
jgi:hypothetical protein